MALACLLNHVVHQLGHTAAAVTVGGISFQHARMRGNGHGQMAAESAQMNRA